MGLELELVRAPQAEVMYLAPASALSLVPAAAPSQMLFLICSCARL